MKTVLLLLVLVAGVEQGKRTMIERKDVCGEKGRGGLYVYVGGGG